MRILIPIVVVAALVAGACTRGPAADVSKTPTNEATEHVSETPTSTSTSLPPDGALEPGTYTLDRTTVPPDESPGFDSLRITFTVPSGWEAWDLGVLHDELGTKPNTLGLTFWNVSTVPADPCHWERGGPRVGPTVDDLATALADQSRRHATTPTDVTLGGYTGKHLTLTVPAHIKFIGDAFPNCDQGYFAAWGDATSPFARYQQGPGQVDELWILDVHGFRLVIDAGLWQNMPARNIPARDVAELRRIVDSVQIERGQTPSKIASACYGHSATDCPYFLDLSTGERTPATGSVVSNDLVNPWYVFSPDGERVAYNTCSEGPCGRRDKILVANADGTEAVTLLPSGGHGIVWSPDGTKLVYVAYVADNLYVHDFAAGRTTRLLDPTSARWLGSPYVDIGPNNADFSPDGRTVIFCRPRTSSANATWDAWAVPVTGGKPTLVLRNALFAGYLADGKRIVFVPSKQSGSHAEPISIASSGGFRRTLVKTDAEVWHMSISPDRTKILYDNASGTHVVDLATGKTSLVTDGQRARWAGNDTLFVELP